jgi:hypothetical protein
VSVGRPCKWEIALSETERGDLGDLAQRCSAAQGLTCGPLEALPPVLGSVDGRSNTEITRELGVSVPCVCLWRDCFLARGWGGAAWRAPAGAPVAATTRHRPS